MPSLFATLRPQVIARDGRICQYCSTTEAFSYSVDHIISRSQGGIDALCNLVVCCQQCNTLKRGRVWIPQNLNAITEQRLDWRARIMAEATPQRKPAPTDTYTIRINVRAMNRLKRWCAKHEQPLGPTLDQLLTEYLDRLGAPPVPTEAAP